MKKQLLLGSALFAAITAFPQNTRPQPGSVENAAKIIAKRIQKQNNLIENSQVQGISNPTSSELAADAPQASKTSSFVSSWNVISSSANPYGVVVSSTKPLGYNEDLNAVTFVQRASNDYVASPAAAALAKTGVIITMVTQNWGSTWDSTCVWNDDNNWARYPQGALLAAPGSTNMSDAHIVGNAAITSASNGWIGNGFFSKQMGQANYNNIAPATNSFIPTLSPILDKADFTVYDFQAMDNGNVVALGYVNNDPNGTTNALFGYRGARVVKGSFVSGNMIWDNDSIIPDVWMTNGDRELTARPRMAWSEDGQVGYVMHIGVAANAVGNNVAYQPIIHRTNNGGNSWAPVSGIDFNLPAMSTVTNMLLSSSADPNVVLPFFNTNEGFGLTVDKDNKLHILGTIFAGSSSHPDSIGFAFLNWANADGQTYRIYRHTPGLRPYIYDFTGDGLPNSPWAVTLIDSMASENPGADATETNGLDINPWAADPVSGDKVEVEARFQSSRTADGKYIVHTWAESDSSVTTDGFKWNEVPNIKARLMDVTAQTLHTLEINVTKPLVNDPFITSNINVANRAYLHYTSPKCALSQTTPVSPAGPALLVPMTASRPYNLPLSQSMPTIHRYMSALLNFGGISQNDVVAPVAPGSGVGIAENALNSTNNSFVYPNPANGSTNLSIDLKDNSKVEISVINLVGQVVSTNITTAQVGQNTIPVNIDGLSKGVYMVNVKVANSTSTKKLIVE